VVKDVIDGQSAITPQGTEPMTSYTITFVDQAGKTLGSLTTLAPSHWDACLFGWDNAPEGTDDFSLTETRGAGVAENT
jgi:hypothetical protein